MSKRFPEDYPKDVVDVVSLLAIPTAQGGKSPQIMGTASKKRVKIFSDIDAFQEVDFPDAKVGAEALQQVVQRIHQSSSCVFIEAKLGENPGAVDVFGERTGTTGDGGFMVEPVDVSKFPPEFKLTGWSKETTLRKLREAKAPSKLITRISKLNPDTTAGTKEFLKLYGENRYGVLRWTAGEIRAGRKGDVTLERALTTKGRFKIDVACWLSSEDRVVEVSMIYGVSVAGTLYGDNFKTASAVSVIPILQDFYELIMERNYWKAMKRAMSIASLLGNVSLQRGLERILNSDLGKVIQIVGDLETLEAVKGLQGGEDLVRRAVARLNAQLPSGMSKGEFQKKVEGAKQEYGKQIVECIIKPKDKATGGSKVSSEGMPVYLPSLISRAFSKWEE